MFFETLWALILGFALSGMVQAFVSKEQMRSRLGDHRPRSVLRAAGYGMVSSSCSYAASAMAKSLFARGADFTTAMIFMVASTNLVIELGLVMLVLMGWQFMMAEFVGGPVMIALLALGGTLAFSAPVVASARERVIALSSHHDGAAGASPERSPRRREGWVNASSYAVADATMLRRELAIGYLVAGALATVVPASWWGAVFLHGHGVWTSVENALVGPLIAVVSWVCSVGNVPLAAALWHGGISFGGVVAFIFADLIAMPLILIYRKFYGRRLTSRLVVTFYLAMVIAGLVTEVLFRGAGLVPRARGLHLNQYRVSWDYTSYLNIVFVIVALLVWRLASSRRRGVDSGYAIDPVCKMQVLIADAPASARLDGVTYYFCADRCRERFVAGDARHLVDADGATGPASVPVSMGRRPQSSAAIDDFVDPICGMSVTPTTASAHRHRSGQDFYFCAVGCAQAFDARGTTDGTGSSTPPDVTKNSPS